MVICDNTDKVAHLDPGLTAPVARSASTAGGAGLRGPRRRPRHRTAVRGWSRSCRAAHRSTRSSRSTTTTTGWSPPSSLDTTFRGLNKGIEGLAALRHDDQLLLLGLGEDDGGSSPGLHRGSRPMEPDRHDPAAAPVRGLRGRRRRRRPDRGRLPAVLGAVARPPRPTTWTVDEGTVYDFPRRRRQATFRSRRRRGVPAANQVVVATDRRNPGRRSPRHRAVRRGLRPPLEACRDRVRWLICRARRHPAIGG